MIDDAAIILVEISCTDSDVELFEPVCSDSDVEFVELVCSDVTKDFSSTFDIGSMIGGSKTSSITGTFTLSFESSRMNVILYCEALMLVEPFFLMSSQLIDDTPLSFKKLAALSKSTVKVTISPSSSSILGKSSDQDYESDVI